MGGVSVCSWSDVLRFEGLDPKLEGERVDLEESAIPAIRG